MKLSSFSSGILEQTGLLIFLRDLEKETGPIRYLASTVLKTKSSNDLATIHVLGLEEGRGKSVEIESVLPDNSLPVKSLDLGSRLILLPNSDKQDSATKYLSKWMDKLEQKFRKQQKEKVGGSKEKPHLGRVGNMALPQ